LKKGLAPKPSTRTQSYGSNRKLSKQSDLDKTQQTPKSTLASKKLAALLDKNNRTARFRAPFYCDYFIDAQGIRFGLVFEKPASVPVVTESTSLHDLLKNIELDMPSLIKRITSLSF